MALRITIDIFSGRPNPVVIVRGAEERDLLKRLAPARPAAARKEKRGRPPRLPPSLLGYRGVIVERLPEPGARSVAPASAPLRIASGFAHGPRAAAPIRDANFEDFICGSTGPFRPLNLDPRFFDRLPELIDRFHVTLAKWPWKRWPWPPRLRCLCAPLWEPAWWNDGGQRQYHNNCYNYGTNYRTDTFAQPGRANGAMYTSITCPAVRAGAVADALIAAPSANNRCPGEGHLVALVVGPGFDFHWYRKGRNGYWTHKPGGTPATNVDNSGNLISDPRTADRDGYTDFCTFMVVMHGHVKLN